jgi:hypothetical protein
MLTQTENSGSPIAPGKPVGIFDALRRLCNSASFAYAMIIALQLKVLWRIWDFKDITAGDTISYYRDACVGLDTFRFNFVWSPLYALFGSTILRISNDPYFYCIACRVILVLTITVLILAVMRRLLPPLAAWLVAAWWAVLPINFNTLYEVHLFAAVPILTGWLILLSDNESRWKRGTALAIMAASPILVRNEQSLLMCFFAACVAIAEWRAYAKARRQNQTTQAAPMPPIKGELRSILTPYLVPLAIAICVLAAFLLRCSIPLSDLAPFARFRHTNNVGQIYCFGYQQRHPGRWNKSPWTEYGDLMTKDFGAPELTITEAAVRNPAAMAKHLAWNARLIPDGLQVLLFNCMAGTITPDYIAPRRDFWRATLLSVLVLSVVTIGLLVAMNERQWVRLWIRTRSWGLIAIACYVPVATIVMVMQRPRASYVFAFGIALMGLVSFSTWRIATRLLGSDSKASQWCNRWFVFSAIIPVLLIATTSSYYPHHSNGRPLLDYVHFLQPFSPLMGSENTKVLVPYAGKEIAYYLYGSLGDDVGHWVTPDSIPALYTPHADISKVLITSGIEQVLIDRATIAPPVHSQLSSSADWRLIGLQEAPARSLELYTRSAMPKAN